MISLRELKLGISFLFIPAIYTGFYPRKIVIITALCNYIILFFLLKNINFLKSISEFSNKKIILSYYVILVICLIRGLFDLNSPQDFIIFFGGTIFLYLAYPSFIFLAQSKYILKIFKASFAVALPLSIVTYFIIPSDGFMTFQHNASFIFLFVFIIPYLNFKWKIYIILFLLTIPLYDITRRSSIVNFSICICILISNFFLTKILLRKFYKFLFVFFVSAPVFLLILGVSGIFNVFEFSSSFDEIVISNKTTERNLFVDSRTGIYQDVFLELSKQNQIILGLGANGKTSTFSSEKLYKNDGTYSEGRRNTESGMLNQILFSGVIGAISFWLLMALASYNAIFKSNNRFIMMLGLFISFKLFFSFVEEQLMVNVETFYLMFLIGLCYNIKVRSLRDIDLKKMCASYFK